MSDDHPKRRYRPARRASKREVWNAIQEQDSNGNLEGVVGLVKGIADRFGVESIEVETASDKIRWRK